MLNKISHKGFNNIRIDGYLRHGLLSRIRMVIINILIITVVRIERFFYRASLFLSTSFAAQITFVPVGDI